jgi:predicted DNA-binding protein (MmcQ/YjbR family)
MPMNIEEFREYCLAKRMVTESFPFDATTLVFKVGGKMFALTGLDDPEFKVNLKCDPDKAEELRETYPAIRPGFHMNKSHWNTVTVDGSFSMALFMELIDHSYALIVSSLPKDIREQIERENTLE